VPLIPFDVEKTAIDGLWFLTMKQISDDRGTVREFYRQSAFADAGLPSLGDLVQVNVTETEPGAIRGMHAENMYKLVGVGHGRAFGAWVDLREGPERGTVVTRELGPGMQALVSPGVANGFQSLGDTPTQYVYVFTQEWQPDMEGDSVHPLDPDLGITWPIPVDPSNTAQLSAKDAAQPPLHR
jgi:dTDP-4-dehydrorhamnose 3,5-epimerase